MTPPPLNVMLDDLARDEPAPVMPSDDLARGRRALRRRRGVATAGSVVVAASVGAALLLGGLPAGPRSGALQPAGPPAAGPEQPVPLSYAAPLGPPTAGAIEYVPEVVSDADALARCVSAGGIRGDQVEVARRPLFAGDSVTIPEIGPDGHEDAGCMVRGPWLPSPDRPIADSWMDPQDSISILYACSARVGVDLQSWTVSAAMADGLGGLSAALASPGQGFFVDCDLGTATGSGDTRFDAHTSPAALHAQALGPEGLAADVFHECSACNGGDIYSWAGVLPRGMESAVVVLGDGTQFPVPVGIDGIYAVRLAVPVDDATVMRTFAADGTVVGDYFLDDQRAQ